jgi:hypothetical protein
MVFALPGAEVTGAEVAGAEAAGAEVAGAEVAGAEVAPFSGSAETRVVLADAADGTAVGTRVGVACAEATAGANVRLRAAIPLNFRMREPKHMGAWPPRKRSFSKNLVCNFAAGIQVRGPVRREVAPSVSNPCPASDQSRTTTTPSSPVSTTRS